MLGNVIHKCDEETQAQLRDAIKILSSTELYAPTITRFRDNDRIANGYYDGLIRVNLFILLKIFINSLNSKK